jgi:hypothetical protein
VLLLALRVIVMHECAINLLHPCADSCRSLSLSRRRTLALPGVYVEKADFLTEEERGNIFAFNALELLGLKREDYELQS